MSVDRSYSPYEVIRAYHDRGMMKWGAFATGELTEAQNSFEKEKKEDNRYGIFSKIYNKLKGDKNVSSK